jgi:hypothetical protein
MELIGWQGIEHAPENVYVDLLSNGAVRFTNCIYVPEKEAWVSVIKFMGPDGQAKIIKNQVKNPTHFLIPPRLTK